MKEVIRWLSFIHTSAIALFVNSYIIDEGQWWINLLFSILDKKATPMLFLTRNLMENATSFKEAVGMLSSQDLIAPAYFILGGVNPDEGVVITRDQNTLVDIWSINKTSANFDNWFLLETNYPHWQPVPPKDDRRTPGINVMNLLTQSRVNSYSLMGVLTFKPVCNKYIFYTRFYLFKFFNSNLYLKKEIQCIQLLCQPERITKMDFK